MPFSRSRSLQEIISWEKLPIILTQVNKGKPNHFKKLEILRFQLLAISLKFYTF